MSDSHDRARWAGRDAAKDRVRAEVWRRLATDGINVGPVWSRIPNFAGADLAAWNLAQLPQWRAASVIKCNPDPPQIPVRLRALYDGKIVYAPVPELTASYPFVRLDPEVLAARGVAFETAATSQGSLAAGQPVDFDDIPFLPLAVVGCVAVSRAGGRIGKGGGFADLELGIFRELGKVTAATVVATTVHSSQVVEDARLPMHDHDSPLDFIATERELIATRTTHRAPRGVDWDRVAPEQYAGIPFLRTLRSKLGR